MGTGSQYSGIPLVGRPGGPRRGADDRFPSSALLVYPREQGRKTEDFRNEIQRYRSALPPLRRRHPSRQHGYGLLVKPRVSPGWVALKFSFRQPPLRRSSKGI